MTKEKGKKVRWKMKKELTSRKKRGAVPVI